MKKNTKKTYEVVKIDGTVYRTNYIDCAIEECIYEYRENGRKYDVLDEDRYVVLTYEEAINYGTNKTYKDFYQNVRVLHNQLIKAY